MTDNGRRHSPGATIEAQWKPSAELPAEVVELGPWFHNIHLPGGVQTAPDHPLGDFPAFKWSQLANALPRRLDGWTALDIGCNAGFYSFELARRGARVTGIDRDPRYLRQATWAGQELGLADRLEFLPMQVYDLARLGRSFDLVLFMGVFYHLRYPMLALDIVAQSAKRLLVFQTLTIPNAGPEVDTSLPRDLGDRHDLGKPAWPKMSFLEHAFAGDPSNWWVANEAGAEAMLRSAGMRVVSRPGHEIWLCEPDQASPSSTTTWNYDELASAACLNPRR